MKRKWLISMSVMVFLTTLIGFTVRYFKEVNRHKVVVVVKNEADDEYWRIFASGAEQAFDDFGIDGKVVAPSSRSQIKEQEIKLLREVLDQNPEALIFAPTNSSAVISMLMEYKKKNIPVLLAETDIEWSDKTTYIGSDNYTIGKKAGEIFTFILQPGDQVALIRGKLESRIISEQIKGIKENLDAAGIEIVTEQLGYDEFGKVDSVMGNVIGNYPEIKGVFATSDLLALDALRVIEEKGMQIPVIGTDGIKEMLKSVEVGRLDVTLTQNPYDMGYISVEQAWRVLNGQKVKNRIDVGIDIVTEENAKEKLDFLTKKSQSSFERFKSYLFEFI